MKRNILNTIMISAALLVGMSSCDDFLTVDPQDSLVKENYYTSASMVRANTAALYSAKEWLDFSTNFQWKADELSGDMFYTYDQEGQFYFGTYTSGNQYISEGWRGLYNVISIANSIINEMPSAASANGVSADVISKAVGEARCVRGMCYFFLTEYWKDVPIIESNTEMISANQIQVPRNTQKSVYEFIRRDEEYAASVLPSSDDAGRATKWTAYGILAKLYVTMASHSDYENRAELYQKGAAAALKVIDESGLAKPSTIDYSTLFDISANNGPESLLAVQCMVYGYGYGNGRNAAWSRSSVIADQTWGGGKGPTISLQSMYDQSDKRRKWVYMTNGDYYANLAKASGGYTYHYVSYDANGSVVEDMGEMLAHIKKYVIGKGADTNGGVGTDQDAANNIYLLRLSDVYLLYAEAIIGVNSSTTDAKALECFNQIRTRAGLPGLQSLSYLDLLKERRREFAFESNNWFDMLRYYYRDPNAALAYINGMNRNQKYIYNGDNSQSQHNDLSHYIVVSDKASGGYDPITFTTSSFILPIPASATVTSPQLENEDPVDYTFSD
jgi:hypothetical protein